MSEIPELMAIYFEPVHPGHGQLDRRYRAHPAIEKFLQETSLTPSVEGKRIRFDFYGSSAGTERPHLHESQTWFLRASFCFTRDRNFSHVLHERKIRQETSLNAASKLIAYACSDVTAAGTTEVEILVHSMSRNKIIAIWYFHIAISIFSKIFQWNFTLEFRFLGTIAFCTFIGIELTLIITVRLE